MERDASGRILARTRDLATDAQMSDSALRRRYGGDSTGLACWQRVGPMYFPSISDVPPKYLPCSFLVPPWGLPQPAHVSSEPVTSFDTTSPSAIQMKADFSAGLQVRIFRSKAPVLKTGPCAWITGPRGGRKPPD